ncbi:hypothetical protein KIN20_004268 [Parelaphostrongylus tenuis]|uniref:Uncharacterized protein n=1 Tax=Parelaphostrongylus tenuis TaxID=148309 RepID=A0AAD5MJJ0_PARTN|nr:hypothetical protein KIN20_004268 [Parelaphostrongylus tenuis]
MFGFSLHFWSDARLISPENEIEPETTCELHSNHTHLHRILCLCSCFNLSRSHTTLTGLVKSLSISDVSYLFMYFYTPHSQSKADDKPWTRMTLLLSVVQYKGTINKLCQQTELDKENELLEVKNDLAGFGGATVTRAYLMGETWVLLPPETHDFDII